MKMRNILMGLGLLSAMAFVPLAGAFAEWTGDVGIKYVSDAVIVSFASGQIDNNRYFCIEGVSVHDKAKTLKVCASSNTNLTKWAKSYDDLYRQAMYYYVTGKKARVYYENDVWKYEPFTKIYTPSHIVGFASCSDNNTYDCYGPHNG